MAAYSKNTGVLHSKNKKEIISGKERKIAEKYLLESFGFESDIFKEYEFIKSGKDLWICTKKIAGILKFNININSIGIRAIRGIYTKHKKATTNFIQIFGKYAKKNIYYLDKNEVMHFCRGENLVLKKDIKGYVAVAYANEVLGIAIAQNGKLINQLPKSRFIKNWNIKEF